MKKFSLLSGLLLLSMMAQANLIVVNSNQDAAIDDNLCTLREALAAANYDVAYFGCSKGLGDDLIWVLIGTSGDSIQLNSTLPIIEGVEIQGPGADNLVLFPAAGFDGHIFQINTTDDVKIKDMRIGGARSSAIDVVNVGELTIEDMQFLNNTAASDNNYGGAIHADTQDGTTQSINSLIIENTLFQSNSADFGGAIAAGGAYEFIVNNSIFEYNTATEDGAAVLRKYRLFQDIDTIFTRINNSQFVSNNTGSGSTVATLQQTLDINTSLFLNNTGNATISATNSRGAIKNSIFSASNVGQSILATGISQTLASIVSVNYNTFINSLDTIDITVNNFAQVAVQGNAFAGSNPTSCIEVNSFTLISNGYNLESAGSSCTSDATDMPNTDANLMALSYYDGDRLVAPPFPLSPLVDAGANCTNEDYSGEGRRRDGDGNGQARCDIGAVERPHAHRLYLSFSGDGDGEIQLHDFSLTCAVADSTCIWPLPENQTYSFTATPDAGSTFIQWGLACSGDTTCDITMDNFKFLNAKFAQAANPVQLTIVKNLASPQLDVTVTSSPAGIVCGPNCSAGFIEGDLVTLTADVEPGTKIDSWQNCDIVLQNGRLCRVGLTADRTVTVNVIADPDVIFANGFE